MVDNGEPSGWDLWVLPLSGERRPFPFLQTSLNEAQGQFSPDGRWVAYISNESGRNEVYVAPFPGPGNTRQVSCAGGLWPRWNRDGREIFFLASDGSMMAAAATPHGSTMEAGAARTLFDARPRRMRWPYAVSPDGQRFLVNALVDQAAPTNPSYSVASWISTPITVVINGTAALKQ
jgi:eukaryotic-like serine/threonine-protein kinase